MLAVAAWRVFDHFDVPDLVASSNEKTRRGRGLAADATTGERA